MRRSVVCKNARSSAVVVLTWTRVPTFSSRCNLSSLYSYLPSSYHEFGAREGFVFKGFWPPEIQGVSTNREASGHDPTFFRRKIRRHNAKRRAGYNFDLPDNIRAKVNGASKRSPSISPRSLPWDKSQYSRFGVRLHKVPNRRQIPPVLPVLGLD